MRNLRLFFNKTDRIKYVSHLDLNRCLLRAIRRSSIPVWYTEGFNPHPYISFAMPLPLGVESVNDIMDMRIDGEMENSEIISRLNECLPTGLLITAAYEPVLKASEIAFACYEIRFNGEGISLDALKSALESDEILCEKTGKVNGKKTVKQINIAENIKSFELIPEDNQILLKTVLGAGAATTVNPLLLIDYLSKELGRALETGNVRRTLLLDAEGKDFQ